MKLLTSVLTLVAKDVVMWQCRSLPKIFSLLESLDMGIRWMLVFEMWEKFAF